MKITETEKKLIFEREIKKYKEELSKKISPSVLSSLTKQFPEWEPIVIPEKSNNEYNFKVTYVGGQLSAEFSVEDQVKKREVVIFFPNLQERESFIPTLAFESNSSIVFQKIAFTLNDKKSDPLTTLCLGLRGSYVKLLASAGNPSLDDSNVEIPRNDSFVLELKNNKSYLQDKNKFETELVKDGSSLKYCDDSNSKPNNVIGFK